MPEIQSIKPWEVLLSIDPGEREVVCKDIPSGGILIQGWYFYGADLSDISDMQAELIVGCEICTRAAIASVLLTDDSHRIDALEKRLAALEGPADVDDDGRQAVIVSRFGTFPTPFLVDYTQYIYIHMRGGVVHSTLRAVLFGFRLSRPRY